jgi:hypothetical protein
MHVASGERRGKIKGQTTTRGLEFVAKRGPIEGRGRAS